MALSKNVSEALADAECALRSALASAARNERPIICNKIAEILSGCENIHDVDEVFDTLDNIKFNLGEK